MRTVIDEELNVRGEIFDTFDEMYRVCEARELRPYYRTDRSAKDVREVHEDKGIEYSFDETKHDVLYGSDIFNEDFEKVKKEVAAEIRELRMDSTRSRNMKDIIGQSVSVERAMIGHPKAFSRRIVTRHKQKTVHLMFNTACPWFFSVNDRMRAGCILMVIIEHLEKIGYQTKLTFFPDFSYGPSDEPSLFAEVCMKDYKTRFNARKMQFPLGSKSVLFQLGCWWNHRTPVGMSDWGMGEGYAVDNDDERKEQAKAYAKKQKAIYLSNVIIKDDLDSNLNKVFEYVFKQLEEM